MRIHRFRVSFLRTETILEAWRIAEAPLRALTTEFGYRATVDDLLAGRPALLGLTLPWPRPSGQHFWEHYLNDRPPARATAELCFRRLVPLRLPSAPLRVRPVLMLNGAAVTAHMTLEGYVYPFGAAVLASLTVEGDVTPEDLGDIANAIRRGKVFHPPETDRDAAAPPETLDRVLDQALRGLVDAAFSPAAAGERSVPFSVATVLTGADAAAPAAEPDVVTRRLLHGLATWTWPAAAPPAEALAGLDTRSATHRAGDALIAGDRGRAVWFPACFTDTRERAHTLACYHRNLTLASLQTESLLMLVAGLAEIHDRTAPVPAAQRRWADLAADLLTRLHAGTETYRSGAVKAQIEGSRKLDAINGLLARLGYPAIAAAGGPGR